MAIGQVKALAGTAGIASVSQALTPRTNVGAATSQGVHAQRVDRSGGGIDGRGITVGALSDSVRRRDRDGRRRSADDPRRG